MVALCGCKGVQIARSICQAHIRMFGSIDRLVHREAYVLHLRYMYIKLHDLSSVNDLPLLNIKQVRSGALYMGPLNAANLKKAAKGGGKKGKGKGKGGGGGSGQPSGNSAIDTNKREYIYQVIL